MSEDNTQQQLIKTKVTKEEVNRVLELGRLLLSVLTQEELEELLITLTDPFDTEK
jgi:hypothetical protein